MSLPRPAGSSKPVRSDSCARLVLALAAGLGLAGRAPAQWNATEEAQLASPATSPSAHFGWNVSISGHTAVLGAKNDRVGGNFGQGSAFVFVRSGTTWKEQATLTAGDGMTGDWFGTSVAIDGDSIAVGAERDSHTPGQPGATLVGHGSVYVFERTGTTWTEMAKLTASDAEHRDDFGGAVAVSGDTILVGAIEDHHSPGVLGGFNGQGSAYAFVRSASTWVEEAKLKAADAAASDRFGNAVSFTGDRAVIGAWLDDNSSGFDQGSAYVFERAGTTWSETAKLIASDGTNADHFGNAVSLSGDTILVGARDENSKAPTGGAAYVFVASAGAWSEQAKLEGTGISLADEFGFSVALLDDVALIGSPFDDPSGVDNAGSTYLFLRIGSAWTEKARIVPPDSAAGGYFGRSVALHGDTGVVGSPRNLAEKAHVYRLSGDPLTYCTAGTSASGCQARTGAAGIPSATAPSGFDLLATHVEGSKRGLFFFGANGRQAKPWFGGSSYQCVIPPVARGKLLWENGTAGSCDGTYTYDLNARWTAKPAQNPGAGALIQAQFWYRDPFNATGPGTSLSDAIEFCVGL